jgi:hypothetical protein
LKTLGLHYVHNGSASFIMQKSLPLLKIPVAAACRALVASCLLGVGNKPHRPTGLRCAMGQGPEPSAILPLTQGGLASCGGGWGASVSPSAKWGFVVHPMVWGKGT